MTNAIWSWLAWHTGFMKAMTKYNQWYLSLLYIILQQGFLRLDLRKITYFFGQLGKFVSSQYLQNENVGENKRSKIGGERCFRMSFNLHDFSFKNIFQFCRTIFQLFLFIHASKIRMTIHRTKPSKQISSQLSRYMFLLHILCILYN